MRDLKRDGGAYLSDYDDEIRQAKECFRCSADFERKIAKAENERDELRTKCEAIRAERDKTLPYTIDTQQQTCKVCGRPMKLDFRVPDTVWKIAVPEEYHNLAVCLYCFDEFASRTGIEFAIDSIHFAGKAIRLHPSERLKRAEGLLRRYQEIDCLPQCHELLPTTAGCKMQGGKCLLFALRDDVNSFLREEVVDMTGMFMNCTKLPPKPLLSVSKRGGKDA